MTPKIIYTKIDEAPALATYSLLPILDAFAKTADIKIETKDISLAGRIIANFPEYLKPEQRIPDFLGELGQLTQSPEANIIKLPNISASVPQLQEAIKELQSKGYNIPSYPEEAKTDEEKLIRDKFAKVLGSAVNPVLREGNSDRRSSLSVKKYAQKKPHKMMKEFPKDSKSDIAHMSEGDFFGNEKSVVADKLMDFKIELKKTNGETVILKDGLKATAGEILDATYMSVEKLRKFYAEQIKVCKEKDVLLSLHLKATMMKVSDPIMFGHAVTVFYKEVLDKHASTLKEIGFKQNNGIEDLYIRIENLPEAKKNEIKSDINSLYEKMPKLAMVDSDKGVTNLHVPNNIIVDASMPVVVRDGGKMWNTQNKLQDTICLIPDRSYAGIYKVVLDNCKKFGAFNPATMGSVANVGLMAQKAEEYGSHPTTFEIPADGTVNVIDQNGTILMSHNVQTGDIWRMARTKDVAVQDWVKLAVNRAKATGAPAIFWLNKNREHDAKIIEKIDKYIKNFDTRGLEIQILSPEDAMKYTLDRVREGKDTISVTGNVLRDYLTDLFPILELGTSAKMLSVVPLLNGGGLFETGAGGSAPKHVEQFLEEGHLRWDSLGEYLALAVSFEHLGNNFNNPKAIVLAQTLDQAIGKYMEEEKAPSRKAGELDTRGTHFYLGMYWAQELAAQSKDEKLKERFAPVAKALSENEIKILKEIASVEGRATDIGGYYLPDEQKAFNALRPSATLNAIIDNI